MRRVWFISVVVALLGLGTGNAQEILDRVIAVVNNTPMLQSDWQEEWRCEALLAGRAPESYTAAEQHDIFERMVDQELLRQQRKGYFLKAVTPEEIESRLAEVRKGLADSDDAKWRDLLKRTGVSEDEIRGFLQRQVEIERFLDARFRSGIRIDQRAVTNYYREQFLPQLHQAGAEAVPLEKVSSKIREILREQQMQELVTTWLQTLRDQADIRIPEVKIDESAEFEVSSSK